MNTYTNRNQANVLAHAVVNNTGQCGVEPAELKPLVVGSCIVLSNGV